MCHARTLLLKDFKVDFAREMNRARLSEQNVNSLWMFEIEEKKVIWRTFLRGNYYESGKIAIMTLDTLNTARSGFRIFFLWTIVGVMR